MRPVLWLAAGFVLLNLIGLDRSPVVWIDEVTLNDPAKELARHGVLRSSVFAGQPGFEESYLWQPPGQPLVTAAVYELFGFGLWQTRVPPLLFAAAAVAALYALGRRLLRDDRAALCAAAIFALDPKLLQAARSGRMDPQCLLFALLGALLAERALNVDGMRRFHGRLALAGLATGLAGITHPLAVAWALGLGLVILWRAPGRRKLTGLLAFAATMGLPAALWFAWGLAAAGPEAFAAQFLGHGTGHLAAGSLLGRAVAELANYALQYELTPLLLAAYAISLPWFLLRSAAPPEAKRTVAALFSATFLFNLLVMTKGLGFYYLYPGTMLALCAGALVSALLPRPLTLPRTAAGRASAALVLLLGLSLLAGGLAGRWLSLAFQWRARDYAPVVAAVRETVPPGSVVWGPAEAWYAVEQSGSSLRLLGHPDPARHDFVVLRKDTPVRLDRAVVVREIGEPLPPVLGLRRASADYTFRIWTWRDRAR